MVLFNEESKAFIDQQLHNYQNRTTEEQEQEQEEIDTILDKLVNFIKLIISSQWK
ncbi:TPA: hypothetical protein VAO37_001624 [Streptococcus agalactiae]|nr:hypothetical protein [Streptococcus agalactiae]